MDGEANAETTNYSVLEEGTMLARDLIDYKLGRGVPPVSDTAKTLRKLSDDIEQRNPMLLEQLCVKYDVSTETGYRSFSQIAKEVFSDGIINWGRIVVIFAFGAKLGMYSKEKNMPEQLDNIPQWIGRFVMNHKEWIEKQGGWVRTINMKTLTEVFLTDNKKIVHTCSCFGERRLCQWLIIMATTKV